MSSKSEPDKFTQKMRFTHERQQMVERQLIPRGIKNGQILQAMGQVPRHKFIPEKHWANAYDDGPLPIGQGQTISQPYIVAIMSELLQLKNKEKILEVGTGSGYQAAVLAEVGVKVFSIEIIPQLSQSAGKVLFELGYKNVKLRVGDGYQGWKEEAPFDGIIITAAPPKVPEPLLEQLAVGGKMVLPLGHADQRLIVIEKTKSGITQREVFPVRFVPMTGEVQKGAGK